jgi:hypothetical protein
MLDRIRLQGPASLISAFKFRAAAAFKLARGALWRSFRHCEE